MGFGVWGFELIGLKIFKVFLVQGLWFKFRALRYPSPKAVSCLCPSEAILDNSDLDQESLEVMLGRVALFGKVFRRLDVNGDGSLSLAEIIKMMEMLNMDTKFAADLMAFLDADDSGEVTWQEFVRGVSSSQFTVP